MADTETAFDFEAALRRAREGDDDALAQLLGRSGPAVRGELQISPAWQSQIDPDDVMQVTYIDAFLRIGSCAARHETAFRAWLAQIARNNLVDAIRGLEAQKRPPASRRVALTDSSDPYAHLCDLVGATTSTPSRAVARDELRSAVDRALERLPADYSAAIRQMDLEGLPAHAVAERMKRSPAAVYMLVGRARERLRELLGTASKFFSS